ncbi:MAG: hypothetical protein H0V88_10770 [Pyrinomonadaceae bacterium]|nr:hypothetical protein [Pyrinomonadaceae bacterium]
MAILKKREHSTETRLLLESNDPVELPPAEVEEKSLIVQFDSYKPFIPELLAVLRAGSVAEPVPVMLDGSTFAIHGETRTFWVKLWHAGADRTRIERAQVLGCLPSTRGVQIVVGEEYDDEEDDDLVQEIEEPQQTSEESQN